jgi:hypothetical protein
MYEDQGLCVFSMIAFVYDFLCAVLHTVDGECTSVAFASFQL